MNKEAKIALEKMNLLTERMDKHYTKTQVDQINEEMEEGKKPVRRQISQDEFSEVAENMKGGVKSTLCYISVRDLFLPRLETTGKKDYAALNRKFDVFGTIKGVVKFGKYTFNWRNQDNMEQRYQTGYVQPFNRIRRNFGLPDVDEKRFGKNGMLGDALGQEMLKREITYFIQDAGGKDCQSSFKYFLIGEDGKVLKGPIDEADMVEFFKFRQIPCEAMLRELGADDQTMQDFADQFATLDFDMKRFNVSNVVSVVTSYKGEKLIYFNNNIPKYIGRLKIDPAYFVEYAKSLYEGQFTEQ